MSTFVLANNECSCPDSSFDIVNDACVCPEGDKEHDSTCIECGITFCAECDSPDNCIKCDTTFVLSNNDTCECPTNFTLFENACYQCDSVDFCTTCSGTNVCQEC